MGDRRLSYIVNFFPALAALLSLVCLVVSLNHRPIHWPIRADGVGYYAYLPSYFLYHDPAMIKYHDKLTRLSYPPIEIYPGWTGISKVESTGRYLDKYNIGTALLISPFFLTAHWLSPQLGFRDNGFTLPFRVAVGVAGAIYLAIGLAALIGLLRREFSDLPILLTLISITFGTNLFHYSFFDSSFSHIYSFAFISLLLLFVARYYSSPNLLTAVAIGACTGVLLLIRSVNILGVVAVVLLWKTASFASLKSQLAAIRKDWLHFAIIALTAFLLFLPQFLVWRYATGQPLVYSYGSELFRFRVLPVIQILFAPGKGLLVTFPILWLALPAIFTRQPSASAHRLLIGLHLAVTMVLYASWTAWDLGGGFGHRGFVESLPILALALAWTFAQIATKHQKIVFAFLACSVLFVSYHSIAYWAVN